MTTTIDGLKEYLPLEACKERRLYRIFSRNLAVGVFEFGSCGFYGVREKFGRRYVSRERHWDSDPVFGTVKPVEDLGEDLPPGIVLADVLEDSCSQCKKPARHVPGRTAEHLDGSPSCPGAHTAYDHNDPFLAWLEAALLRHGDPR